MDINETMNKWKDIKYQIQQLEKQSDKYKQLIESEMEKTGKKVIKGKKWTATKKYIQSHRLVKKDVPEHIWDKYNTVINYTIITLSKTKT